MDAKRKDSNDVINAIIRRDRPLTRMGVFDYFWGETMDNWIADEGYPVDEAGVPMVPEDYFGLDMIGAGGWVSAMPHLGPGSEELIEETEEWVVKRNGAGAVLKNWKRKAGTPEHIDFHMTSRSVWDSDYRDAVATFNPARINIDGTREKLAMRKEQGYWTYFGLMFVCEMMRCSMGDVCMLESMLLDPAWIDDYCRVYTDMYKACYKQIFDEAGTPDGIWIYEDLGYRNGLFCSPTVLNRLMAPYYAEMVAFFHSYDVPVVLHSCGRITEALPMIVDAGFDALHPMEVKAGVDAFEIAETYGDN